MSSARTIYELTNVTKAYDGRTVLSIPHLSFSRGESCALVGPNGSGKTTLLRLLALIEKPTTGRIVFDSIPFWTNSANCTALVRRITMVAHPPYLFNRSVAYNIAYGMKLRGMPKYVTRERTRELLKMVGLEGFEKKDARKLSSGQQQRVVLARSLALEPEVLLLDEPTASIDRKHSEELESLIAQLSRQKGMTVLFSTHNYHQAVLLAERIISLYDGRVEPFAYENLFGGTIYTDGETSRIQVSEVVTLSLVSESSGQAHISIDPRDITLSREPVLSPQMNCCLGKLKSMAIHDSHVKLIVDIGVSLTSIMRQDSLRQLGLTLGEEVYCIFKPDAVKTI